MQYLHYSRSHPYHTKKAIPFSLALRGQRLNSSTSVAETCNQRLQEALVNRGYPSNQTDAPCILTHSTDSKIQSTAGITNRIRKLYNISLLIESYAFLKSINSW